MTVTIRCTIRQLPALLRRDARRVKKNIENAKRRTAEKAIKPIRNRAPKAFGELREAIYGFSNEDPPRTVCDAPHAAAVEVGSLPHTPDWNRLVAWVKLRGLQGLTNRGSLKTFRKTKGIPAYGPTTAHQARRVASMLRAQVVRGKRGRGRHSPIDAPEKVALAISRSIEKHGTRPHWFVRSSLNDIRQILHTECQKAIKTDRIGVMRVRDEDTIS